MPRAVDDAIWQAIGSTDYARVVRLLGELPRRSEWLRANGEAAASLSRAKGHEGLALHLLRERAASLTADAGAASLDRELRDEVAHARRTAAASSAYVGSAQAGLGGNSCASNLEGLKAVGIDPLRRMMRDESEAGSSFGGSSRSSRSGSSRRSSRSGRSKRSGKPRRHKRRDGGEEEEAASSVVSDEASEADSFLSDEDMLEELDEMLDAMRFDAMSQQSADADVLGAISAEAAAGAQRAPSPPPQQAAWPASPPPSLLRVRER